MPVKPKLGQQGRYWIDYKRKRDRQPQSENWYYFWYDDTARQTRAKSLGTPDFHEATIRLTQIVARELDVTNVKPEEFPLDLVWLTYWEQHGSLIASAEAQKIALRYWQAAFAGKAVADLLPKAQTAFIHDLIRMGHSPQYISRTLSTGRAALRFCWKQQMITSVPFIRDVANTDYVKVTGQAPEVYRRDPLTAVQVAKLLDVITEPHLLMFCLMMLATAARPENVLDLRRDQIRGDWVQLNPPGRAQTKKFRPDVLLPSFIQPWLDAHAEEFPVRSSLIQIDGASISSIKTGWRGARQRAGLPSTTEPKVLRHTVAQALADRGIERSKISDLLGHRVRDVSVTTGYYIQARPSHLEPIPSHIDAFIEEVQSHMTRRLIGITSDEAACYLRASRPRKKGRFTAKPLIPMVGATGIEPVTPTMST